MGSFLKFGLVPDNDVLRDSKSPEAFISPDGFFIGMLGIIRNYYTKIHITLLRSGIPSSLGTKKNDFEGVKLPPQSIHDVLRLFRIKNHALTISL